jgi:hypothetical protein
MMTAGAGAKYKVSKLLEEITSSPDYDKELNNKVEDRKGKITSKLSSLGDPTGHATNDREIFDLREELEDLESGDDFKFGTGKK